MTYGFVFPEIHVKDVTPEKKPQRKSVTGKLARGNPTRKYDHQAMIADRLNGMAWEDIAKKHGVAHGKYRPALMAYNIVMYSKASAQMTPEQVRLLAEVGYCKKAKP